MPTASDLYGPDALRALEALAADACGDAFEPMRRAGSAAYEVAARSWPRAQRIVVICGPGNNGGDGYVFALRALEQGRDALVVRMPAHQPRPGLASRACGEFLAAGGLVQEFNGTLPVADLLVDALFGIGFSRVPGEDTAPLIDAINSHGAPVLALDVPSGVVAATGAVPGAAVEAGCTVEFIVAKAGLRTGAARDHVGRLELASLSLDPTLLENVESAAERLVPADLARWLRPRRRDSHKGRHGRVLLVGGDHGHGGAIILCAEAALRSGAGLVEVLTREAHVSGALARVPEAMVRATPDAAQPVAAALSGHADVIAIGPGLGQDCWGRSLFEEVRASGTAMVLDADALNLLALSPCRLPSGTVLTPHPGEAGRLLGCTVADVQADRFASAAALVERYGAVVVLKGAGTIIAAPGRTPRLIDAGNPGMAVGGMGDLLTGAVAAMLGQGLEPFDAASAAALLHSAAGDAAAAIDGQRGLLPTDLTPWLRRLSNPEFHPWT
ncbi:NAD(P)H-hydrate dehydratase [Novilysobacter spongiicola]|uniref:Bifunctional NAD(P)H-hydrate repair enzyme n=1 Tax=Lysobacter spongiicola DSM 21749 TaxID=1122188 RepID=A0A1T4MR30_9GAMM|nr:NAD(P)H-hydrate dehydratase [Lysobacter spongiicola]SJZ69287.1 NAD(P)H-hydrate epimerase [Lysobacter spongiicola DSM 21749]